jgi:predicted  nucleic acid-binding Zn-ribbon protein
MTLSLGELTGAPVKKSSTKAPSVEDHMADARSHMSAAEQSIQAQDHTAAADHLSKAAVHSNTAAQYYQKNSKNWIDKAIKKPGSFTKQAKAAGQSVQGFASKVKSNPDKFSSTTVKRANLAKTLEGFHKG